MQIQHAAGQCQQSGCLATSFYYVNSGEGGGERSEREKRESDCFEIFLDTN